MHHAQKDVTPQLRIHFFYKAQIQYRLWCFKLMTLQFKQPHGNDTIDHECGHQKFRMCLPVYSPTINF